MASLVTTTVAGDLTVTKPNSGGTTAQQVQKWTQTLQNTLLLNMYGGATDLVQLAATNAEQNISIVTEASASLSATTTKGIYIKSGGNVGIATDAPSEKLDVEGSLVVNVANSGLGEEGIFFRRGFSDSNKYNISILAYAHDGAGNFSDGISINGYDGVSFCTGASTRQERMRIVGGTGGTSGFVGIGTVSPAHRLDVNGGSLVPLRLVSSGYSGIEYHNTAGTWVAFIGTESGGGGNRYNSAASKHTFYNNSSAVVTINSDGNVGIGETSPDKPLHIKGTNTAGIVLENTTNATNIDIDYYSNGGAVQSRIRYGEGPAAFYFMPHASQTAVSMMYDGNVGINTTSPSAKLAIESDGSHDEGAEIVLKHANNISTDIVSTLSFQNSAGQVAMMQAGTTGANNTGYISFFTDNAGTSSEKVRIIGDGNVGIGTETPGTKLEVFYTYSANMTAPSAEPAHSGLTVRNNAATSTYGTPGAQLLLMAGDSGTGRAAITAIRTTATSGAADLALGYGSGSGGITEGMRITYNGKVGIGTNAPGSKLDVIGTTTVRYAAGDFSTKRLDIQAANTSNLIQSVTNPLHVYDNSAIRITMLQGGSVGIGTETPGAPLHVYSNGSANTPEEILCLGSNTSNIPVLQFSESVNAGFNTGMSIQYRGDYGSGDDNALGIYSIGSNATTAGAAVATFKNGGNVGIGTTDPGSLLTISGNSDNGDGASALRIIDEDSTGGSKLPAIMFYGGSTMQGRIRGGDGSFAIAVGSSPTTAISIDTSSKAITFNSEFTFPTSDGSANQVLKTNGSGTLSWTNQSGGSGTVTSVATSGAITGGTITTSGTISHSTANGYKHIPANGADLKFLAYASAGTAEWAGGLLNYSDYALFAQRYDDGSFGGALSGGQWNTRVLNATVVNNYTTSSAWASLSSNKISLQAGTYYARVWAVAYDIDEQQINLANVTTGNTLLLTAPMSARGNSRYNSAVTMSEGTFAITTNGHEVIAYHWADLAETNTYGGGIPLEDGSAGPIAGIDYDYDTYVSVQIWRVA